MSTMLLLCFLLAVCCASRAADDASLEKGVIWIEDDDVDVKLQQDRILVTLNGPRSIERAPPQKAKRRRSCEALDLTEIPCGAPLRETISTARHCLKTDSLIVEPKLPIDQLELGREIECIVDFLDEDPDQIELDPVVHILSDFDLDQWHISAIAAYGSDGHNAWDITRGSDDIIVAIIDTGVDYSHADLRTNMWVNNGEIPGNGIDDDGNGYIDDVFGYDFFNEDGDPQDDNGHGTHCAGIVGGVVNIKRRVSGVSPNVRVMALKAMDKNGSGRLSDVIAAVEYSLDMGARITSNSFGTPDITHSNAFSRLLRVIEEAGQLYVAAAGNKRRDVDRKPEFPASLDSPIILSVAATTEHDQLADFSNYGAESIDLGAPGVNILSTKRESGYKYSQGTSSATPLVAATAALVMSTISRNSNSTAISGQEVKQIIMASVDPVPALKDKTVTGGRLNAANAVRFASDKYDLNDIGDESAASAVKTPPVAAVFAIALVVLMISNQQRFGAV